MTETKTPFRPRRGLAVGVAAAAHEVALAMHMRLPGDALERLVRSDLPLRRALRGMRRPRDGREPGLDTHERDMLFDAVARHVGMPHWPMYLDDERFTDRFLECVRAAVSDGRLVRLPEPPRGKRGAKGEPAGLPVPPKAPARPRTRRADVDDATRRRLSNGIEAARYDVARATAAGFPDDGLERLVAGDRDLCRRLRDYGPPASGCNPGLDTADREHLLDVVARHLGATHWPSMHEGADACTALAARVHEAVADGRLVASDLVRYDDDGAEIRYAA